MDGVAVRPLTVSFVETPFLDQLNAENQLGHHFQLSGEEQNERGNIWGPAQPQSLNRYAYVLNNPVKYTDPTGHCPWCRVFQQAANFFSQLGKWLARAGVPSQTVITSASPLAQRVVQTLKFHRNSIQHTFTKHAKDFGVTGNWDIPNGEAFAQALRNHVSSSQTVMIQGTYRGNAVHHFYNPQTGLWAAFYRDGTLAAGWKLYPSQIENLFTKGFVK